MPIAPSDIRFLASERMTDDADGGGRMTAVVVQSGADNNVWPDISTVDRARGAVELRKLYLAALSTNTDVLMDAHAIVEQLPADPAVSVAITTASDLAEQRADLVARLHTAALYGAATLTASAAVNDTDLALTTTTVQVVPMLQTVVPSSGPLNTDANTRAALIDTGVVQAVPVLVGGGPGFGLGFDWPDVFYAGGAAVVPGSVSGTLQASPELTTVASTSDSAVTFTRGVWSSGRTFDPDQPYITNLNGVALAGPDISAANVTAGLALKAGLPVQRTRLVVTSANRALVYVLPLPANTVPGTEHVELRDAAGGLVGTLVGQFSTVQMRQLAGLLHGTLNRGGGECTVVLPELPPVDGILEISWCAAGGTAAVPVGALSAAAFSGLGLATLAVPAGQVLASAVFKAAGTWHELHAGVVRATNGLQVGAYDTATGTIAAPALAGMAITEWTAVAVLADAGMSNFAGVLPSHMQADTVEVTGTTVGGNAFTVQADASGMFSGADAAGKYVSATGALDLSFTAPVRAGTLEFSGGQVQYVPSVAGMGGLSAANFPADGRRPIFRQGDVVVLHHSANTAAAAVAPGQTINCGRTDLAALAVVDAAGSLHQSGFSSNLAAGTVTIADITGWAQPVQVRHTIEHVAVVAGPPSEQAVRLNRPLLRGFPVGAVLSSAAMLGDLQARVGASFSQQAWGNVWQDERIGDVIAAQYNQAAHPIEVRNDGAVTERWAIIFTTSMAFRVVGERLGQIATGDINSVLAPVNPATGQPYFTLRPAGWGGGWSGGNVLRLPTHGANGPLWGLRTTVPSVAAISSDAVTLAGRGDVNA